MIFNFKQFVNEMKIYKKEKYTDLGWNHLIYPSKNPNMLYKLGSEYKVNKWLSIFKKHPDLFPIIYKTGKFTYEGKKCMWVLLEKLNTNLVLEEWKVLTDCLYEFIPKPSYLNDDEYRDIEEIFKLVNTDKPFIKFLSDYLKDSEEEDMEENNNYYLFLKWVKFFEKLSFLGNKLDIHKNQYGYDKNGNIKCLDI